MGRAVARLKRHGHQLVCIVALSLMVLLYCVLFAVGWAQDRWEGRT